MVFVFWSASLKAQHGQAISPSLGEHSALLQQRHILTLRFSQWYLPHEMALRMSLYNIAQPVGAMLSGAMQGALSTNLEGVLGRTGWRWAFIINVSGLSIFPKIQNTFWYFRVYALFLWLWLRSFFYLALWVPSSCNLLIQADGTYLARSPESACQTLPKA